jgi:hypothetical protein
MVMSPAGVGTKIDCAGEGQHQFTLPDPYDPEGKRVNVGGRLLLSWISEKLDYKNWITVDLDGDHWRALVHTEINLGVP